MGAWLQYVVCDSDMELQHEAKRMITSSCHRTRHFQLRAHSIDIFNSWPTGGIGGAPHRSVNPTYIPPPPTASSDSFLLSNRKKIFFEEIFYGN